MATFLAGAVVVLAAPYLLGFGVCALLAPRRASRYLLGFASSFRLHLLELIVRLIVGVAIMGYAAQVHFVGTFYTVGLILVSTTLGLALLPWRWHRRIARSSVPAALPYLPVLGVISIAAGAFACWAVVRAMVG